MNCYNHYSNPAVAICKNCNKGLCPDCANEVENGIACSTCIEEVKALNKIVSNSKKMGGRTAGAYYRNAFIYFALGALFLYTGIKYADLKTYGTVAGSIFLIGGFLMINAALKYQKSQN